MSSEEQDQPLTSDNLHSPQRQEHVPAESGSHGNVGREGHGSVVCRDASDTTEWGRALGAILRAGDVVVLDGPLGAGKTTMTRGIAEGLNVTGRVSSPTFTIARLHRPAGVGPSLIHMDAYRLIDSGATDPWGALDSLDLDAELDDAVVVAEWGAGLVECLSNRWLEVTLDREVGDEARRISWRWCGTTT